MKGYKINKKLFKVGFYITLIMIIGLITIEGVSILKKPITINCPETSTTPCPIIFKNGTNYEMQPGENIYINKHDSILIPITNYGTLTMLLITLIINHLLYNKDYPLKKIFSKENIGNIAKDLVKDLLAPLIWISKKLEKK